jgi:hypothetical protein
MTGTMGGSQPEAALSMKAATARAAEGSRWLQAQASATAAISLWSLREAARVEAELASAVSSAKVLATAAGGEDGGWGGALPWAGWQAGRRLAECHRWGAATAPPLPAARLLQGPRTVEADEDCEEGVGAGDAGRQGGDLQVWHQQPPAGVWAGGRADVRGKVGERWQSQCPPPGGCF